MELFEQSVNIEILSH